MPTSMVKALLERIKALEGHINDQDKTLDTQTKLLTEIATDNVWIKRIIVGAAGLGFLEKALGWWLK